jgi:hypothetical protein
MNNIKSTELMQPTDTGMDYTPCYKQALYNKRTWLNKSDSPSLGSVIAFDGEVKYSDGAERTTFLAISDCGKTIKLIKNTENIDDFINKMKLLKSEIELFINHLEKQNNYEKY